MYRGKTIDDEWVELGSPLVVTLNMAEGVPADDLEISVPCSRKTQELKEISLEKNGKNIFSGIVDSQKFSIDASGAVLNIVARSRAACLLDNEAMPQTYCVPSLLNIFNRHVKPYGFANISGDMRTFSNEFVVSKGMSEWEVLENFCINYLKVYPRINQDGAINATGNFVSSDIIFSNDGHGIRYSAVYENLKRHELFSEVAFKATTLGAYSTVVKNTSAINRGIVRRRLLNAANSAKTPLACGEMMLANSDKKSYEICVFCPEFLSVNIGDNATVCDNILGNIPNLVVSELKYVLGKSGEYTRVVLRKNVAL